MLAQDLGFDKQFVERWRRGVGGGQGEHDFRVTCYIKYSARGKTVGDAHPAQLDVIIRRNGDFGLRLNIVIAAAEHRTAH